VPTADLSSNITAKQTTNRGRHFTDVRLRPTRRSSTPAIREDCRYTTRSKPRCRAAIHERHLDRRLNRLGPARATEPTTGRGRPHPPSQGTQRAQTVASLGQGGQDRYGWAWRVVSASRLEHLQGAHRGQPSGAVTAWMPGCCRRARCTQKRWPSGSAVT
jgi:hypothetical protein